MAAGIYGRIHRHKTIKVEKCTECGAIIYDLTKPPTTDTTLLEGEK